MITVSQTPVENDGYYTWIKGLIAPLTTDFGTNELACHCSHESCQEQRVSIAFMAALQALREDFNERIQINRGYSCQAHQDDLKAQGYETAAHSQHVLGNAADITARNLPHLKELAPKYFKAIGTGSRTLHVDGRQDGIHRWGYGHGM